MNAMNAMTKKQRKQNTAKRNEELNATNQMVVTPAHYEELEELQLESVAGGNPILHSWIPEDFDWIRGWWIINTYGSIRWVTEADFDLDGNLKPAEVLFGEAIWG